MPRRARTATAAVRPAVSGLVATARGGRGDGRRRVIRVDLLAVGGEHVPPAAEVLEALTRGVTGGLVACEVVERVAVVGHLAGAVRALGGAEQCGLGRARGGGAVVPGEQRWPHLGTRAGAGGRRAGVGLEQVQAPSCTVDQSR